MFGGKAIKPIKPVLLPKQKYIPQVEIFNNTNLSKLQVDINNMLLEKHNDIFDVKYQSLNSNTILIEYKLKIKD